LYKIEKSRICGWKKIERGFIMKDSEGRCCDEM